MIVRQALRLFEDYYVHLVLKRSLHGVDPVQRLRVLLGDGDAFPDTQAFHEEVLSIFTSVRDLHTTYKLPKYFHQRAAVLPFRLEEYFEATARRASWSPARARDGTRSELTAPARRSRAASW